jgi:hypothetical protein
MYLHNMIVTYCNFQEPSAQLEESVSAVLRSPPKTQSEEVSTLTDGDYDISDILCHPKE